MMDSSSGGAGGAIVEEPAAPGRKLAFNIQPGEAYTIRRKVLTLLGKKLHIYDPHGQVVGFCKQKAFKLRDDIRIYTDESCTTELVVIKARSILDFGATFDVTTGDGAVLGSFRRKGLTSTFLRDSWMVFDAGGRQVADLKEDGGLLAVLRHWVEYVSLLYPERFTMRRMDGTEIAKFRQHFNPFVYRLSIAVVNEDAELDDLVVLAAGCLIAAVEGRQSAG
jgi:uncharacterized protein YxjI